MCQVFDRYERREEGEREWRIWKLRFSYYVADRGAVNPGITLKDVQRDLDGDQVCTHTLFLILICSSSFSSSFEQL